MDNKTAREIQKALSEDLGLEYSILEVRAMRRLQSFTDCEVYAVVNEDGLLCGVKVERERGQIKATANQMSFSRK